MLRRAALIAAAGLAGGLMAAAFASVMVSRFLFGLGPRDPVTLAAAGAILAATAMLAGYFPARRAAHRSGRRALR